MKSKGVISQLFHLMGWFKITQALSCIFVAVGAVLSLYAYVSVYEVAKIIITATVNEVAFDRNELIAQGCNAVFMVINGYALYGLGLLCSHITAFNTVIRLEQKLIVHISKLPLGYHSMNSSGKVRKIIEKNSHNIENIIAHQMPDTVQSVTMPIAFLVFMFVFDWRLSLSCLVPILIGFVLLCIMMKDSSKNFVEKQQIAAENISNAATEYVRGISVVKAFGQSASSFKRYINAIKQHKEWMMKFAMSMKTSDSIYNTIINATFFFLIPTAIVIYNSTQSIEKLVMSFIFFCVISPLTVTILMRIMSSSNSLMLSEASLKAINSMLDEKPLIMSDKPQIPTDYNIELKNVSFRYDAKMPQVIHDISLKLPSGSVTALVGQSGGGKSTIVNLIARFWDTSSGEILIGSVPIKEIDYKWLMDNISIVFQETSMFKMSIADNVAFSKKDATKEQIAKALHLAQCDDILEKFSDGMDTVLGTKGVYLSGGEMQRIALARAILKDAPIVLLDEATAFADSENEYLIHKALSNLLKNKTVVMIAHRLSTIVDADKICVINNGKITESGRHDELINQGGIYADMFREYMTSISGKIGGKASE